MRRTSLLVVLGTALSVGCAHPGIGSAEGWNAIKTKHFTMYAGGGERFDATLTALEYSHAALSSSPFFKDTKMDPIEVLFVNPQDMDELFGLRRSGAAVAAVPGGGKLGQAGLIVVDNDPEGDHATEMLTHLFIHKRWPKAPLWFHEGFSLFTRSVMYQEGDGKRVGCFGKPSATVEAFVPLSKLLAMSWDDYDGNEARGWYKRTAGTIIDFIIFADGGKYFQEKMGAVVDALNAGKGGPDVMAAAFPGPLADMDSKIVEHGNTVAHQGPAIRGICPLGIPIPEEKAPDNVEAAKSEPLPAADMKALMDGLQKLPRRSDGYPPWFPAEVAVRAGG